MLILPDESILVPPWLLILKESESEPNASIFIPPSLSIINESLSVPSVDKVNLGCPALLFSVYAAFVATIVKSLFSPDIVVYSCLFWTLIVSWLFVDIIIIYKE